MEIVELYADSIWGVKYEGNSKDIFSLKISQWRDMEYMYNYFDRHRHFIENYPFWSGFTFQEVVSSAQKEGRTIVKDLGKYYWNGINGGHPNLDDAFVVLERYPIDEEAENRKKMYGNSGSQVPSVLRLYAIKIESEEGESPGYVITGGAIKLTAKMRDMKELEQEYRNLRSVQEWLKQHGITTKESLYKLRNEKND